jgi:hypothetical protein
VSSPKLAFAPVGSFSANSKPLGRQEESGLFGDVQLGQQRELILVAPMAYDLAIPHLGKQRARHLHSSPGRRDGLSGQASQPFGVGTAPCPVDEDMITLSEEVQHLEVDVRKSHHEALVVPHTLGLVRGDRHTGMFCDVVLQGTSRVAEQPGPARATLLHGLSPGVR